MMQVRPQDERMVFRHFVMPVLLPNIQAALCDDKQVELADRVPLGMFPSRAGQAVARANVVGKRKRGELDRRHARKAPFRSGWFRDRKSCPPDFS